LRSKEFSATNFADNLSVARDKLRKTFTRRGRLYFREGMYFQFLGLPSASHMIDVFNRSLRVSSRFASLTHSTYSRRLVGLKFSNVFLAFGFLFKAAAK